MSRRPNPRRLLPRLALLMFLEYAIWGAWLPVAARYLSAPIALGGLGFDGYRIGMILGLGGSAGALTAPFIAGQLADRHFRTERCLAVLLALGGIVKWITAYQTSYAAWLALSVVYGIVYMPTLALTNSLCFAQLESPEREFPKVRVLGTVGWIAVAWAFPIAWLETNRRLRALPPFVLGDELPDVTARLADALVLSGMLSIVLAVYCLTLPPTRPYRDSAARFAFTKAIAMLKSRAFLVLMLTSLAISVIHQIYFLQTSPFLSALGLGDSLILPAMSVGQFSEILVMALLGTWIARFGFRRVIAVGAAAYALRYAIFGTTSLPLGVIIGSQVLHGICYACFFAAAFIFVDRVAEPDVRHSAQTLFGVTILGGGPILGGWLSGALQEAATGAGGSIDYALIWYSLAGIGLAATLGFVVGFPRRDVRG